MSSVKWWWVGSKGYMTGSILRFLSQKNTVDPGRFQRQAHTVADDTEMLNLMENGSFKVEESKR